MDEHCRYCRQSAQFRCAECGVSCCWAHIAMAFDDFDASHLLCDECRGEG